MERAKFFQTQKKKDTRLTVHMEEKIKIFKASKMEELLDTKCSDCSKCKECVMKLYDQIITFVTMGTAKNDSITEKVMKNQMEKERRGEQLTTEKIREVAEKEEALQFTKEEIYKDKNGKVNVINKKMCGKERQ